MNAAAWRGEPPVNGENPAELAPYPRDAKSRLNGLILRSNQREKELLGYGSVPLEYDGIHVSKIHWDKKKIELLLSRLAESVPVIDEKAFMLKKEGEIFVARIYSGLRLKGGAFENTRCFLFADANQNQKPVEMQEYTFPRFNDYEDT